MRCLYVYNKIDQVTIEEVDRLARLPNSVVVSCELDLNMDTLLKKIWETLNLTRIHTKRKGERPDTVGGIIMRNSPTVEHVVRQTSETGFVVNSFSLLLLCILVSQNSSHPGRRFQGCPSLGKVASLLSLTTFVSQFRCLFVCLFLLLFV